MPKGTQSRIRPRPPTLAGPPLTVLAAGMRPGCLLSLPRGSLRTLMPWRATPQPGGGDDEAARALKATIRGLDDAPDRTPRGGQRHSSGELVGSFPHCREALAGRMEMERGYNLRSLEPDGCPTGRTTLRPDIPRSPRSHAEIASPDSFSPRAGPSARTEAERGIRGVPMLTERPLTCPAEPSTTSDRVDRHHHHHHHQPQQAHGTTAGPSHRPGQSLRAHQAPTECSGSGNGQRSGDHSLLPAGFRLSWPKSNLSAPSRPSLDSVRPSGASTHRDSHRSVTLTEAETASKLHRENESSLSPFTFEPTATVPGGSPRYPLAGSGSKRPPAASSAPTTYRRMDSSDRDAFPTLTSPRIAARHQPDNLSYAKSPRDATSSQQTQPSYTRRDQAAAQQRFKIGLDGSVPLDLAGYRQVRGEGELADPPGVAITSAMPSTLRRRHGTPGGQSLGPGGGRGLHTSPAKDCGARPRTDFTTSLVEALQRLPPSPVVAALGPGPQVGARRPATHMSQRLPGGPRKVRHAMPASINIRKEVNDIMRLCGTLTRPGTQLV